jgi:serine/threonine protein kinase
VKKMFTDETKVFDDTEIKFLLRARNSKLVMFFGCGTIPGEKTIFVVLELMDKGDFRSIIWEPDHIPSWKTRLRLLLDASEGMTYLHVQMKSLHRDLKTPNILLASYTSNKRECDLVAKIGDFGLARYIRGDVPAEQTETKIHIDDETSETTNFVKKISNQISRWSTNHVDSKKAASCDGLELTEQNREKTQTSSSDIDLPTSNSSSKSLSNVSTNSKDVTLTDLTNSTKSVSAEMTCNRGTPLWMAPELVKSIKMESRGVKSTLYSQSVDVYSFGIILWETMELRAPWVRCLFEVSLSYMLFLQSLFLYLSLTHTHTHTHTV